MSHKIEVVNVCSVKGVLAGGRAICGQVGCGEPWKCWSDNPCENKRPAKLEGEVMSKEP